MVKGSLEASGEPQTITITAAAEDTAAPAGTTLLLAGPGISSRVHLGTSGTTTVTLKPKSPGTLTVSQPREAGCATVSITISAVAPGQFTG